MGNTERKLVTVDEIKKIHPIEGADNIEVAQVRGWPVVVKKGEFKEKDLCFFFEVDSLIPVSLIEKVPDLSFLLKNKTVSFEGAEYIRIHSLKLRGQLSQGLVIPFKNLHLFSLPKDFAFEIGMDLTEKLGVKLYEPPTPGGASLKDDTIKGNFPFFIPKTDAERIQNIDVNVFEKTIEDFGSYYQYQNRKKIPFYVTEKLDGTSATYFVRKIVSSEIPAVKWEKGICSRNKELYMGEGINSLYHEIEKKYDILNKLEKLSKDLNEGIAIQGEIVGEGIQKNVYKRKGKEFYLFSVFFIDEQRYLPLKDNILSLEYVSNYLEIPLVPIVNENLPFEVLMGGWKKQGTRFFFDIVKSMPNNKNRMRSYLKEDTCPEGIVIRPNVPVPLKYESSFDDGLILFPPGFILKYINDDYLLKHDL
jgi:RNA ligase (TIGR02306 family)